MIKAFSPRYFVPVIIFLISFEVLLRISGTYYIAQQDTFNEILSSDSKKFKILAIGDSTTDESFAVESGVKSWPKQLQEILNLSDHEVRVYNKGSSGINSYFVVKQIEEFVEIYKPEIVVAMMGINDIPNLGRYHSIWYDEIKTIKLLKNFYKFFFIQNTDQFLVEFLSKNQDIVNKTYYQITNDNLNFKKINLLLSKQFSNESELFYFKVVLIEKLLFSSDEVHKHKDLLADLIENATESKLVSPQLIFSALYFYNLFHYPEKCLYIAEKTKKQHGYHFSQEEMSRILSCYDKLNFSMKVKYKSFFTSQLNSINIYDSENVTADNYLYLYNILQEKNIDLVVVGYPNQTINSLKSYFNEAGVANVKFVSNVENFKPSLNSTEYKKYFIDRFADTFGHATTEGNRLIAEAVATSLKPALQK